jgi:hypothetical protein
MRIWYGISTSPAAEQNKKLRRVIDSLRWDSFHHPDATTIRPRWRGEPFDLHACVQALFTIKLPEPTEGQDQQAA